MARLPLYTERGPIADKAHKIYLDPNKRDAILYLDACFDKVEKAKDRVAALVNQDIDGSESGKIALAVLYGHRRAMLDNEIKFLNDAIEMVAA